MRKILPIVLILALIAGGAWFVISKRVPNEAIALKLNFHKGQVDKYKVSIDITEGEIVAGAPKASPTPANSTSVSMTLIQSVERINPDGSADIKYTIRDMKSTKRVMLLATEPSTASYTATIGNDGKIIKMDQCDTEALREMSRLGMDVRSLMSQISDYQLPKRPACAGETWNGTLKLPGAGPLALSDAGPVMDVVYKLVDPNELAKRTKAARISGQFSYDDTFENLAKKLRASGARYTVSMKGQFSLQGNRTIHLSCREGKLLRVESNIKAKATFEAPKWELGSSISVRMDKID